MTTVNTVEDIIEALDSDPFLLESLRARLLTRDLIELPQVAAEIAASQLRTEATLRQFMETTNARFDSVEENQKIADARFDSVEENQKAANARFDSVEENQKAANARFDSVEENQKIANARFDSVEENQKITNARFDSLETIVVAMKIDLDIIKGDHMELRLQGKVESLLAERMNLRRVQIVRALFPAGNDPKFLDAVYDAEDGGVITERLYMRVINTDLIVSARPRGGGETVYVALEVSNKLDREDVDRVALSGEALALIFPEAEVLTAVYGWEISDGDRAYAESKGVATLLDASRR